MPQGQFAWREYPKWPVTTAILGVNIIIFLLMSLYGDPLRDQTLLRFGAEYSPYIFGRGEWWRLITPMFVHIGALHLLVNSISLWQMGSIMERIIGSRLFLGLYLITGIGGNLLSYFSPFSDPGSVSVGASGALFGLLGALLSYSLVTKNSALARQLGGLLVLNLAFTFTVPGIDSAAHVGGLLTGAAVMILLVRFRRANDRLQWLIAGISAGLIFTALGMMALWSPSV